MITIKVARVLHFTKKIANLVQERGQDNIRKRIFCEKEKKLRNLPIFRYTVPRTVCLTVPRTVCLITLIVCVHQFTLSCSKACDTYNVYLMKIRANQTLDLSQ